MWVEQEVAVLGTTKEEKALRLQSPHEKWKLWFQKPFLISNLQKKSLACDISKEI